jgi:ketosteroid isomerase-like protein
MQPLPLPAPVTAFIAAVNHFDLEGLMATFAEDAIVNDHRCEFRGRDALREWAAREIVGDRVTMTVVEAARRGDGAIVSAEMDGTFSKAGLPSPFVLSFYFSTDRDHIAQLVIVAPATPPSVGVSAPNTTLETNKQTVRQFFERFAAGDVPGAVALFSADATFWYPTTRKTLTMPEFAEGLSWIKTRLDGPIAFELGEMVAENNKVAVQLESFARTVEGKKFNNLYHVYFEFEGAKIKRGREYNDTAHVFSTLRAGQRKGEE